MRLATNDFLWPGGPFAPIVVDGQPLFSISEMDGMVSLSAILYDHLNHPALVIHQNELVLTTSGWDIMAEGPRFIMRSAPRQISLEIDLGRPMSCTSCVAISCVME